MEKIHLKSIDPFSQTLLRDASQRGIALNWERYEKLLPQDGFLRLGLSCPYGCMQGPCRIDPFLRGPQRGVCGMDRDLMTAAMLLRLCIQGAMDASSRVLPSGVVPEVSFSRPLEALVAEALPHLGEAELSLTEIFSGAARLQHPSGPFENLLTQAVRLSLLTLSLVEQIGEAPFKAPLSCQAGYRFVTEGIAYIGITGRPPQAVVDSLYQATGKSKGLVQLVSLGEWITTGGIMIPLGCSSGEAELLISSGFIRQLVAGPDTEPGLIRLCETLDIPVVRTGEVNNPEETVNLALQRSQPVLRRPARTDLSLSGAGPVVVSSETIRQWAETHPDTKMFLIGGADVLTQPVGQLPIELALHYRDKACQVAGWGDAATWMVRKGLASEDCDAPVQVLAPSPGPLLAVRGMAAAGRLGNISGICYTGLKESIDLSIALGLSCLGLSVGLAVPIPLWGSRAVTDALGDIIDHCGGRFIHFDHPVQPDELLECFGE